VTGAQVRTIARQLLDRSQLLQAEAIGARGAGARRAAVFLETMATGIREDALALARGFPAANDGGPPEGPPPAGGEDDPTNPTGAPPAAA